MRNAGYCFVAQIKSAEPQRPLRWLLRGFVVMVGLFFLFRPGTVSAQNYLTNGGVPSYSAPEPVELGLVDAANGQFHLEIPLGSYPQRGSDKPLKISLGYNSTIWTTTTTLGSTSWSPNDASSDGYLGWLMNPSASRDWGSTVTDNNCQAHGSWVDGSGTTHLFALTTVPNCANSTSAHASDSSGYWMYWDTHSLIVYAPDGSIVSGPPNGMDEDTNGNEIKFVNGSAGTDTLGRSLPTGGASYQLTFPNSQGSTSTDTLSGVEIPVKTKFGQSGITEYSGNIIVLQSLTLPDNTKYTFHYDCDSGTGNPACSSPSGQSAYYGLLTEMTLPTGGTISYYWQTFSDSYGNRARWLFVRSAPGGTYYYQPQVISQCRGTEVGCQQKMTVTRPDQSYKVYTFTLNNGAWPVQVLSYDSSGNLLATVNNTYDFSQSCPFYQCNGAAYIRLLTSQTTVPLPNGQSITKKTQYGYDSPQTGNVTALQEWRYYSGTSPTFPSVPDRATYTTYLTTGTNDIDRPLKVTTCNNSGSDSDCPGGGSKVSQTLYTYDSYSSCSSGLVSVTGIVNHDDTNFGANYTTRGNVTQIQQWVSGSNYLTTRYCYDTTGQVLQAFDSAGNPSTYIYADNFFNETGASSMSTYTPSPPTNAYPTSITQGGLTSTFGYYYGSGNEALFTDPNGETTQYFSYDPFDRPTETLYPIGWKLTNYTSATQIDSYGPVGDTSPSTGCTSCRHVQTGFDTWGRKVNDQLVNAPGGPFNVQTTYDSDGRIGSVSHPYTSTSDPNYVFETFAYDGLDRQLTTIHPDNQVAHTYYGPNVSSVGGSGYVSTQQGATSTYGYGYPVLTVDEAGKARQEWLDGFGRVIEVDEPATAKTPGVGSVTLNGGEQTTIYYPCGISSCPTTLYDQGSVSVGVGGYIATYYYGQGSTSSSMASGLASSLNSSGSPVTATVSGSTITLVSKAVGGSTNYSLSTNCSSNYYPQYFSSPCPSFWGSPSGPTLTGGSDDGSSFSTPVVTSYVYDALDNLTQVVQGVQTRSYAYDGLGRSTSITTPEAHTLNIYYTTSSGSLCSGDPNEQCRKTDARGITTTYTYDNANRLTGKTYSDGTASVTYTYNQGGAGAHALGRLTSISDGSGSETYTYGLMGRLSSLTKVVGTTSYTIGYAYNAGGGVTQITYPSGRVVQQSYDDVGRLCEVAPSTSGCGSASSPYSTAYSYNGADQLLGLTYGNGVTGSFTYAPNSEQLSTLSYGKGSSTYFSLNYFYQNDHTNCPNGPATNDGQIQCIQDNVDSGRSATYTYDALGRLTTAVTAGSTNFPQWGLAESYDQFGNRLSQTVTAGSGYQSSLSFAYPGGAQTNHPDGWCFDASGNLLSKTSSTCPPSAPNFTYDAEDRMTSSPPAGVSYLYDGNGTRVERCLPNCTSPSSSTVYIFSGSRDIAEYDNGAAPSSPSREFIYSDSIPGSGLLATITGGSSPTVTYFHDDHLGWRVSTDGTPGSPTYGQVNGQQATYPFGESWYSSNGNQFVFTTYQRDSQTGLDYAMARFYDSGAARFCSADPVGGNPDDPQTWNRYAYVRNDPVNLTDPNGQFFGFLIVLLEWLGHLLAGIGASSAGGAALGSVSPYTSASVGLTLVQSITVTASPITFSTTGALLAGGLAGGTAATGALAGGLPQQSQQQQPQQQAKKPCPQVPTHPNGADIDANIRATEAVQATAAVTHSGNATAVGWWVNQVKTRGPWDYKYQPPGFQAYDDFGNFNYGATGSIFFDEKTLDQGAAFARYGTGNFLRHPISILGKYGSPFKGPNFGNDPHKNEMIREGIKYRENHCGSF